MFRLGGNPAAFALLADFGEGGPSAVRIYAGAPGKLSLAARVDRYAQKDFFDDYIELVPVPGPVALLSPWRGAPTTSRQAYSRPGILTDTKQRPFGCRISSSNRVMRSVRNGLQLNYCADPDPDDPRVCHQTRRERFAWQDGAWKQAESVALAPAGSAKVVCASRR